MSSWIQKASLIETFTDLHFVYSQWFYFALAQYMELTKNITFTLQSSVMSELTNLDRCSICLQPPQQPVLMTGCHHAFCAKCICQSLLESTASLFLSKLSYHSQITDTNQNSTTKQQQTDSF
eukprot:532698_1